MRHTRAEGGGSPGGRGADDRHLRPGCDRLGYKATDDKWRDCVLRLAQRDERRYSYYRYPVTTSCIGHRGFYNCTTF